ncbi:hypothetical protein ACROYT_G026466 [Oculina patagonica]
MNNHLLLLRQGFKRTLDEYEVSTRTLGKKFTDAVLKNASFNNLPLPGKISKQHIVCNNELFLLIQVHSLPENFMSRQAIRLSWGSMDRFIGNLPENNATKRSYKTVFLIGQSSNPNLNHLVDQEASIYKDIVVGSFEDTYRNLYKKMIFSINWPLDQKCDATYIFKTDEDCFVNVGNLLNWLSNYHEINGTRALYAGRVQFVMPVIRDNTSRYYVSERDHPAEKFQPYVSGGGYVLSGFLLPLLAKVSKTSPLFANEDALLGSLLHRLGVQPTDNKKFLPSILCVFELTTAADMEKFQEANMCGLSRQIVLHGFREKRQLEMHFNSAILNYFPSFCSLRSNYKDMRDRCK